MAKLFVSNSQESTRMFKNDLLESLSKVHFWVPLLLYIPLILFLTYRGLVGAQLHIPLFTALVAGGFFTWTLTEYVLHRYIFHFEPSSKIGKRLHFIFYGVHHAYPNDAKRLVMPLSASIPLAAGFYFLFDWLLPDTHIYGFFSGFIAGYLVYDMMHYALHHYNFKSAVMKRIKKHHMLHHYSDPDHGYGVSSEFWDRIFRSGFSTKRPA